MDKSGPVTTKMKVDFFFPMRYLRVLGGYLQMVGR